MGLSLLSFTQLTLYMYDSALGFTELILYMT